MKQHLGKTTVMTSVAAMAAATASTTAVQADSDWTGFYAGISVNKNSGDIAADYYGDEDVGNNGSLFAGYNHDFGNFVAGAELAFGSGFKQYGDDYEASNNVDLKFKVGKAFGNTLVYGIAGISSMTDTTYNTLDHSASGMSYGVGVEQRINDRFSVGVEYLQRKMDTYYNPSSDISSVSLRGIIRF